MALCCIGGVCIPYSAIVPLLIYGLQWLLQKLVVAGLLPAAWCEALSRILPTKSVNNKADDTCCTTVASNGNLRRGKQMKHDGEQVSFAATSRTSSCCSDVSAVAVAGVVTTIDSDEEWERLLATTTTSTTAVIVCKFTAVWCKPCKAIQPVFESLAAASTADTTRFVVVDVDALEDVASTYNVMALPTFVALHNGKVLDKYSGSNETVLREWVESVVKKSE